MPQRILVVPAVLALLGFLLSPAFLSVRAEEAGKGSVPAPDTAPDTALTPAAVPSGAGLLSMFSTLGESPYYHLGDTEWDHGGVEEYYFNCLDSSCNEIYREL